MATDPRRIAVVAFPGISPFHLAVPGLIFAERAALGLPRFDLRVCAERPGTLATGVGYDIVVTHDLSACRDAGTIILPSWPGDLPAASPALCAALNAAAAGGARLVGLCLGAFVLAEAGLLDGRRATTHWRWLPEFAARHPAVRTENGSLYVTDGAFTTSAGTVAAIDCCLHLLRQELGATVTARLARQLVTPPYRQGNQAQYIDTPLPVAARDARLAALIDWMRGNLAEPMSLDGLAERARMSRRTFTRRFQASLGTSPLQWLLHQRLQRAQHLLETTPLSLERIAAAAGLGSALSLRQHFARQFDTTPSAYRREFSADSGNPPASA